MSSVVAFVLNDARHDSRVLREASTLAAAGFAVLLVGRTVDPLAAAPDLTPGPFALLRVPVAAGILRWLRLGRRPRRAVAAVTTDLRRDPVGTLLQLAALALAAVPIAVLAVVAVPVALIARRIPPAMSAWKGVAWRVSWHLSVLPWARRAAEEAARLAPDATLAWAHDMRALPAAIELRERLGAVAIVYDAHEIFPEAGEHATRPAWGRAAMTRLEASLARRSDALVTVNEQLREVLVGRLGIERVVVARNCPPRWTPPPPPWVSPLRSAAGVPDGVPIVLYHGGLAPGRGIEALARAMADPSLARAHLVFLGSGPSRGAVRTLTMEPGSRVHLLDPVDPGVLLEWVNGADVAVAAIEPTTMNHRLSSPNKVFEAIAAGVPVVGSDLPGIREVVMADPDAPLGALVDPRDPGALARAIAGLVDAPPAARAALRERCLAAAHRRWNWETEGEPLVALARDMTVARPDRVVPQRIAFVLPSDGAHDARTRRLATDLVARGHQVTVIARAGATAHTDAGVLEPGVRLVRLDVGAAPTESPGGGSPVVARLSSEARRIAAVALRARRQAAAARDLDIDVDLVHAMGFLALPPARALARRLGVPYVYDARDLYVESNNVARMASPIRRAFAAVEGRWARGAARVFTVNDSCAEYLERRYRVRRPVVVMNGQRAAAAPVGRSDRLRERLGLDRARRIVLYHGGFMPDRGLPELIVAVGTPTLEDVDLVLMGSGAMEPRLRTLADSSPARDRLHFLPPVEPAELLDWVASADVGAMPNQPRTLNERLSTPNKLFECLAAGTPVVSSDFPERRRVVLSDPEGPVGRLCDPTDPSSIAAAIRELLDLPPDEMDRLRARCRRVATERYGWEAQLPRALAAYGEITGRAW